MTHWMCINCGYYLQTEQTPDRCPSCKQACAFTNVTCYRPDCGGERNIDPLVVGAIMGNLGKSRTSEAKTPSLTKETYYPTLKILDGLDEIQKAKVKKLGNVEIYEPGAVICREGEKSSKLYLIEEGQAIIQSKLGTTSSIPLTTVSEDQAFGWSSLVPPYILNGTVSANEKTTVLAIENKSLLSLMHSDPSLGCTIMQNIAGTIALRLRNVELEMVGLINQKSK
jgi:hypothetical protein